MWMPHEKMFTALASAAVADFFAANLATFVPGLGQRGQKKVVIASILLLTALNVRGVRWGSTVQNVVTVAKMVPIVLLIVGGAIYASDPLPPAANVTAPAPTHTG